MPMESAEIEALIKQAIPDAEVEITELAAADRRRGLDGMESSNTNLLTSW